MRGRSALLQLSLLLLPLSVRSKIDREAVVRRHNVWVDSAEELAVLSVGNGNFAFNVDATGLQTFNASMILATQSSWGWHTSPFPALGSEGTPFDNFSYQIFNKTDAHGRLRQVPYATCANNSKPKCNWFYSNPHRLNLGQMSLMINGKQRLTPPDVTNVSQSLDLYKGYIDSNFTIGHGCARVRVETAADAHDDTVAIRMRAPSCLPGLGIQLAFPFAASSSSASDWHSSIPGSRHSTIVVSNTSTSTGGSVVLSRRLDADAYFVHCRYADSRWILSRNGPHSFVLLRSSSDDALQSPSEVQLSCKFSNGDDVEAMQFPSSPPSDFTDTLRRSSEAWGEYWNSGAALDLSRSFRRRPDGSTPDPGLASVAFEAERRLVLSQYLMRVHTAGPAPPQETGLFQNSWGGKHHQEMRYWHHAHFAVWNRSAILRASDQWYIDRIADARASAALQGCDGTRWPKMVGPNNHRLKNVSQRVQEMKYWESFNPTNALLLWHQPHVIAMAELERRAAKGSAVAAVVDRLSEVVDMTARFLADYVSYDLRTGRYHLGPPVIEASERHSAGYPSLTSDPVFELVYVNYTLGVANSWREYQGLKRNETWDKIRMNLSPLPIFEYENQTFYPWHAASSKAKFSQCGKGGASPFASCGGPTGHPAQVAAVAMVPGFSYGVEMSVMVNTLRSMFLDWDWGSAWGWDFGLLAMASLRAGEGDMAMNFLMHNSTKNTYLKNGANLDSGMPYLPGNGALLLTFAMASGGWDGDNNDCPDGSDLVDGGEISRDDLGNEISQIVRIGGWEWEAEGFVKFV